MPNRLVGLSIGSVDLVDKGAQEHGRVALWKRDGNEPSEEEVAKFLHQHKTADLRAEHQKRMKGDRVGIVRLSLADIPDEMIAHELEERGVDVEKNDGTLDRDDQEEQGVELNELLKLAPEDNEVRKAIENLDEDTRKAVGAIVKDLGGELTQVQGQLTEARTELEKAQGGGETGDDEGESEDELLKNLDPQVRQLLEKRDEELTKLREQATESTKIAKDERDRRLKREWTDRVEGLDSVAADKGELVERLKALSETDPELAENVFKSLQSANEAAKQGNLTNPVGSDGKPTVGSETTATGGTESYQKMREVAKGMVNDGKADSIAKAMDALLDDDEYRQMYVEHLSEES